MLYSSKYPMRGSGKTIGILLLVSTLIIPSWLLLSVDADNVPDWIKRTAKWYGDDQISEQDFLNAIKFLIEERIIVISDRDTDTDADTDDSVGYIVIPNGNSLQGNTGFYLPINLEVKTGTTVIWQNDDVYGHTVQSQTEDGKPSGVFNSAILETGDTFEYTFTEPGEYHYYCTLHPWRVGVVTVS